jgi:hypothetical protein
MRTWLSLTAIRIARRMMATRTISGHAENQRRIGLCEKHGGGLLAVNAAKAEQQIA